MEKGISGSPNRWGWLIFVTIALVVFATGYAYYTLETERIRNQKYDEIASIAKLKTKSIQEWRKELLDDVRALTRGPMWKNAVNKWFLEPDHGASLTGLRDRLETGREQGGYADALLLDLDGNVIVSASGQPEPISPIDKKAIEEAGASGSPVLIDMYRSSNGDILMGAVAPILDPNGRPIAVGLYRANPASVLFPLIRSWPTGSQTAETLLVRRDGDDVLSLNDLRHRPDTALSLRRSITLLDLPAAQAVTGKQGLFQGRDYRGVEVLADLRPIPDSPWFMVTKVDTSEILAEANYRGIVVVVFSGLFVLLAGGITAYGFKNRQASLYHDLYQAGVEKLEAENERREIYERLEIALEGADLGVWDWHVQTGKLVQDPKWLAQLEYQPGDVENNIDSWATRIHPDDKAAVTEILNNYLEGRTPLYSAEHRLRSKSGKYKWILTRGKVLERDESGKPVRMVGTHLDIDSLRQYEQALLESERKFRVLTETIHDVFWVSDPMLNQILYVSPAYEKVWGKTLESLYKSPQSFFEVVHPDDIERFRTILDERHKQGAEYSVEYRIVHSDNSIRWILERGFPIHDEKWRLELMCGVCTDVTERKETETELRKFKTISDGSNYGNTILDLQGNIIYLNEAFARMHGFVISECTGKHISMFHTEQQMSEVKRSVETVIKNRKSQLLELWHKRKDGTIFPTLMNASIILDDQTDPLFLSSTTIDISDRKRMENELRESEDRQRSLVEHLPQRIFVKDRNSVYLSCNENYAADLGITPAQIVGKDDCAFHPPELAQAYRADDQACIANGVVKDLEEAYQVGGEKRWIHTIKVPYHDRHGKVTGVLGIFEDITERRLAEDVLLRLAAIVESSDDAIIGETLDGTITTWNHGAERLYGYSVAEAVGCHVSILIPPEALDDLQDTLTKVSRGEVIRHLETKRQTKDGQIIDVSLTISPIKDKRDLIIGASSTARDISDRVKAEQQREALQAQLLQAQKMEAIGTLAGGIAHDFNNILFAIVGNTELAMDEISEGAPAYRDLEKVLHASARAAEMVKQILTFSRQGQFERKPLDIVPVVKEALKFLKATIPVNVEIKGAIEPDQGKILGDPTQIYQVLMNLCVNASHAMKDTGGVLTVDLRFVCIDRDSAPDHNNLTPGDYLRLSVSDTGRGIPVKILNRIFEPYFTTKNLGEGTGFGLSVVHGIVRSHDGAIIVDSQVGEGTSFHVYLPVIEHELGLQHAAGLYSLPTGSERILLVDDDPMLVEMVTSKLEKLGYQTTATTNPVEALRMFHDNPERFDLVFTDLAMPVISGAELTQKVKLIRPDIPVIVCTGSGQLLTHEKILELGVAKVIYKPLFIKEIAETLREVLDTDS